MDLVQSKSSLGLPSRSGGGTGSVSRANVKDGVTEVVSYFKKTLTFFLTVGGRFQI